LSMIDNVFHFIDEPAFIQNFDDIENHVRFLK